MVLGEKGKDAFVCVVFFNGSTILLSSWSFLDIDCRVCD